jgi:hypothetical protein
LRGCSAQTPLVIDIENFVEDPIIVGNVEKFGEKAGIGGSCRKGGDVVLVLILYGLQWSLATMALASMAILRGRAAMWSNILSLTCPDRAGEPPTEFPEALTPERKGLR